MNDFVFPHSHILQTLHKITLELELPSNQITIRYNLEISARLLKLKSQWSKSASGKAPTWRPQSIYFSYKNEHFSIRMDFHRTKNCVSREYLCYSLSSPFPHPFDLEHIFIKNYYTILVMQK